MKHIYFIMAGLAIIQLLEFSYLNSKLELLQTTSEMTLGIAKDSRAIAFEAKRAADAALATAIPPSPNSCNPETGHCHTSPFQDFIGKP